MSEPRILVIGEKFIDRYYVGTTTRISPEAPIPVVVVKEVIQSAGGAGNVSANLKSLGIDPFEYYATPYPEKNRLVIGTQQLARWDVNDVIRPMIPRTLECYKDRFQEVDGIIISDYNKGGFTCETILAIVKLVGSKPIFIDSKTPTCWPLAGTFFFPNMKEWQTNQKFYNMCANVIRTESENGMTHINYGEAQWHTPTYVKDIVSVCGAGDTAIAAFAYDYCKHGDVVGAMRFASKACAVVVGKPYTAVASHEEINKIKG